MNRVINHIINICKPETIDITENRKSFVRRGKPVKNFVF